MHPPGQLNKRTNASRYVDTSNYLDMKYLDMKYLDAKYLDVEYLDVKYLDAKGTGSQGGGESAEVWGLGVVIYYVPSKKLKIKNRLPAKHPLYLW